MSSKQHDSSYLIANYCISLAAMVQVILARGVLIHVAALLDKAFQNKPTAELYFVMVMCPLCMNLVQVDLVFKHFCRSAAPVCLAAQCTQQSKPVIWSTGCLAACVGLKACLLAELHKNVHRCSQHSAEHSN